MLMPSFPHFIYFSKDKKLRDHHQGDLGRVIRSIPVGEIEKIVDDKDDYDPHPFVYDIDLVLGGKLMAVRRSELQYTTAFEEGMTGDSRQRREKRKQKEETSLHNMTTATKTKKGVTKQSKKVTSGKALGGQGRKKRVASGICNNKGKAKKPRGASSLTTEPVVLQSLSNNGLDMFERHRREFERSLIRLEKADVYGYFTASISPEHEESITSQPSQPSNVTTSDSMHLSRPPSLSVPTNDGPTALTVDATLSTASTHNNIIGSSTQEGPPINFTVMRKRLDHGRYILDQERYETAKRISLMTPYYKSIGKKIPSDHKNLPGFSVHHKKSINWDLFRTDVMGMCDAAIQRSPHLVGDGAAGTLNGAARKINELMEQIYDKIARKHALEMETSNDTHRFTAAINSSPNTEAAMQGKRWRREGKHLTSAIYVNAHALTTFVMFCYLQMKLFLREDTKNLGVTSFVRAYLSWMNVLHPTS
jgi:hypothetical protein